MRQQDGTQSSAKQRRSRKTSTANQQNGKQARASQRSANDDKEAWESHWKTQGQPWRTEPEIDVQRQDYLAERRSITPNIEQGIYPFKDIKLRRADVEWLLTTHEDGRGPVDWSDKNQRKREGLDLRGADLSSVNLSNLPLARLRGTLASHEELSGTTDEQRKMAAVKMKGTNLSNARLEGAILGWTYLEQVNFQRAHLEEADLSEAHLEQAYLVEADLKEANLEGAHLRGAYLEKADLREAYLSEAHLEEAHLQGALLAKADLQEAYLEGAQLREAILSNSNEKLKIGPLLADIHWGDVNLAVVDWSRINKLGDEEETRLKVKDEEILFRNYEEAIRANRQLAVILQAQGLNEHAGRFAYKALVVQKTMLLRQIFQKQITITIRLEKLKAYLFSVFLFLLSGYGYKLRRSFISYLFVIVGFAIAYYVLGPTVKISLTPLEALIFSMTSFHGRGFSPGENIGLSNPLTILAAIEALVGLIIEVILIATLTQRFFRK